MGLPEALVQRSAEARAAETGASVDEILAAWAGGETPPADTGGDAVVDETAPAGEEEVTPAPTPAAEPAAEAETAVPAAIVEAPPPEQPAATARAPVPSEVSVAEASHLPEVITVPTAGIKERTNFVIPKWLTGLMVIVPLFALFALGGASTGACGEGTELAMDVISGEIVNCDGTEFTGGGIGGGGPNYLAIGEDIYVGAAVTGVNCSGCHGATGQGSGAFPALTGVLTTFGSCADHVEWVSSGSAGFAEQGFYGDTQKTVSGGMPTFSGSLTPEQIAAVASFERVRFGGADPDVALADCGLVEGEEVPAGDGAATEGDNAVEAAG
jgi:hypothetical protein